MPSVVKSGCVSVQSAKGMPRTPSAGRPLSRRHSSAAVVVLAARLSALIVSQESCSASGLAANSAGSTPPTSEPKGAATWNAGGAVSGESALPYNAYRLVISGFASVADMRYVV